LQFAEESAAGGGAAMGTNGIDLPCGAEDGIAEA
jgi:hypothetical protein